MEELIPFNTEIVGSGSNSLPVFCGWFQGKHNVRGKKFIIRINGEYYECFIKFKGNEDTFGTLGSRNASRPPER